MVGLPNEVLNFWELFRTQMVSWPVLGIAKHFGRRVCYTQVQTWPAPHCLCSFSAILELNWAVLSKKKFFTTSQILHLIFKSSTRNEFTTNFVKRCLQKFTDLRIFKRTGELLQNINSCWLYIFIAQTNETQANRFV